VSFSKKIKIFKIIHEINLNRKLESYAKWKTIMNIVGHFLREDVFPESIHAQLKVGSEGGKRRVMKMKTQLKAVHIEVHATQTRVHVLDTNDASIAHADHVHYVPHESTTFTRVDR